ncbi:MAG: hypothetical protein ACOYCB_13540 [Fastidiosipilaceae bacterium]|jgi:hypothetical protein
MKKWFILIVLLIVGLLFAPAVSAYEQTFTESQTVYGYGEFWGSRWLNNFSVLKVKDIIGLQGIDAYAYVCTAEKLTSGQRDYFTTNDYGHTSITGTVENGIVIFTGQISYHSNLNPDGSLKEIIYVIEFDNIDIKSYTGGCRITLNWDQNIVPPCQESGSNYDWTDMKDANDRYTEYPIALGCVSPQHSYPLNGKHMYYDTDDWYNTVKITETDLYYTINFIRENNPSRAEITDADTGFLVYSSRYTTDDVTIDVNKWLITSGKINVTVVSFNDNAYTIFYPQPGEPTGLRTGSVTMTDHNGTSIYGFEVTAVNHYTGESYTVTTDTDVAVIDLPMDRKTEIRNPQTGEYETAPAGYYTFYGQAPGYKMLFEDGIKVVVTPVKYDSYKLCDILVTSDSGPLTGKHKFQIRSRADNSILQTGTISAKSVTTGEWYNTTVSDGIATLILAYDTTSILSEYAGLYYVYATSPGYEDSDYGTQISVYPHTVSEIKTVLLTPIGGVPTPGNVTLRIQAISETGQGVVNAEIFIAGLYGTGKDVWNTYTTSSTGYLTVSVPGNSTYDIVASADGFYDSARRIEVFTEDPGLIELKLYLSGYPTITPPTQPTQPTDWPTDPPTQPTPTQPTGGIPDEDDDSDGFLMESVRGIANLFGVSFGVGKTILGMLLALGIGTATAKHLRGGAQEFGMGMLGGVVLGVLTGLLPIWVLVLLVLIVGLWIGQRYMSGGDS